MVELDDFAAVDEDRRSAESGLIEEVVAAFSDYESIGAEVSAALRL